MSENKTHMRINATVYTMDKWTELRTAYKLAKHHTLSATAEQLGVHRSTVMRHIDSLEETLGVTLFQRSDKGYMATEAGLEMMRLGEVTENHFSQLSAKIRGSQQQLAGTLRITSVNEMAGLLMPAIEQYQSRYPQMQVEYIGDLRNYNLEYGEADIAIRAGSKPTTPDNIVMPITELELVLSAHQQYLVKHAHPHIDNLAEHRFVALQERPEHLAWNEWIYQNIPSTNIVFRCSSHQVLTRAVEAGCGIGVLPRQSIHNSRDLVQITQHSWPITIWALIHRDMYSLAKIRAFIEILRELGTNNQQWTI